MRYAAGQIKYFLLLFKCCFHWTMIFYIGRVWRGGADGTWVCSLWSSAKSSSCWGEDELGGWSMGDEDTPREISFYSHPVLVLGLWSGIDQLPFLLLIIFVSLLSTMFNKINDHHEYWIIQLTITKCEKLRARMSYIESEFTSAYCQFGVSQNKTN